MVVNKIDKSIPKLVFTCFKSAIQTPEKYENHKKYTALVEGSITWLNNQCWLWCFATMMTLEEPQGCIWLFGQKTFLYIKFGNVLYWNVFNYKRKVRITKNFECELPSKTRISLQVSTEEKWKIEIEVGEGAIFWYHLQSVFINTV